MELFTARSAVGSVLALLTALLLLPSAVDARPGFVARLPNGGNVVGIAAVGHINIAGGGTRNQFGLDFAAAGRAWTPAFCAQDSDGDGQTNGQELGDPCCVWNATTNANVLWTSGVSHPGDATKTSNASLWANVKCTTNKADGTPSPTDTNSTTNTTATTNTTTTSGGMTSMSGSLGIALATAALLLAALT